jgi:hypothetical protein
LALEGLAATGGASLFAGTGNAFPLGGSRSSAGALGAGWPARTAGVVGVALMAGAEGGASLAFGIGKVLTLEGCGGTAAVGGPDVPPTAAGALAGCGLPIGAAGPRGPGNLAPGITGEGAMEALTDALGGSGAFPCCIRFARVAAAAGNAGPTTAVAVPVRTPGLVSPGEAPRGRSTPVGAAGFRTPAAGRALMTLLMTFVL